MEISSVSNDLVNQYMLQMQQQDEDDAATSQVNQKKAEEELTEAINQNMQQTQQASQGGLDPQATLTFGGQNQIAHI